VFLRLVVSGVGRRPRPRRRRPAGRGAAKAPWLALAGRASRDGRPRSVPWRPTTEHWAAAGFPMRSGCCLAEVGAEAWPGW